MSALRLGRLPDGTRDVRVCDDGAVGRSSFTRYAIRGSSLGELVVVPKGRDRTEEYERRKAARKE